MNDLTLIPTENLIKELLNRHDHMIITGIKNTKSNGEYVIIKQFVGNRYVVMGMMDTVKHQLCKDELSQINPLERNIDR